MDTENKENIEEDFEDFGEETDFVAPTIDELNEKTQETQEDIPVPNLEEESEPLNQPTQETIETTIETRIEAQKENKETESIEEKAETSEEKKKTTKLLNHWEELNQNDEVVKKYITYINKENIKKIDSLNVEDRNNFINEAIKLKVKADCISTQEKKKKCLILHTSIMIITAILFLPIAIFIAYYSINLTFKSYRYTQKDIEKLYLESFKKNNVYVRSLNYNKKHSQEK